MMGYSLQHFKEALLSVESSHRCVNRIEEAIVYSHVGIYFGQYHCQTINTMAFIHSCTYSRPSNVSLARPSSHHLLTSLIHFFYFPTIHVPPLSHRHTCTEVKWIFTMNNPLKISIWLICRIGKNARTVISLCSIN